MPKRCAHCGFDNPDGMKFCGQCAAPLASTAERRQLTVLFCDLVGSTELSEQLDPEEWGEILRRYQELCAGVIGRFEGHIARYFGDGLLVYFGYPMAHEDSPQRAARTALGIVDEMKRLNAVLHAERHLTLAVRLGIHTGLVVVGDMGGGDFHVNMAVGDTPNIAARLQALAEPDAVIVSAVTHRLIDAFFACESLGEHALKGISQPMTVYRVLREAGAGSRIEPATAPALTPLVGRERELAALMESWERAKAGAVEVVLLYGEPGIGKSRLVRELKERVRAEAYHRIECRASPYHQNTTLYPLVDALQRALDFRRDDAPAERLDRLERLLSAYGVSISDTAPLFAALLDMTAEGRYPARPASPQEFRRATMAAFVTLFTTAALAQPVVLIVEDLQWIDPSTLELLGLLVEQPTRVPILMVLTSRSELAPPWVARANVSRLTLGRLRPAEVETFVERVTRGKRLPPEVREHVVSKTDGIPLFVEELTKMVTESSWLAERADRYELTAALPALEIPTTLYGSLMARLDRLGAVKEVARLAATLGREFSYDLLQAVSPLAPSTLQEALAQLVDAEMLHQRGTPSEVRYAFKHGLVQEAAYQSLLKSRRQQYHQQIVQVLEEHFPEAAASEPEVLAHHCTEAGLLAQAIPYWERAGQRAARRFANAEAISHLTKALDLLGRVPETRERLEQAIDVRFALRASLWLLGEFEVIRRHLGDAEALAAKLGDQRRLGQSLVYQCANLWFTGQAASARAVGDRAHAIAAAVGDPQLRVTATIFSGLACIASGEHRAAAEILGTLDSVDEGLRRQRLGTAGYPVPQTYGWLAWSLAERGDFDAAVVRAEEGLRLGEALEDPHTIAVVCRGFAHARGVKGELGDAIRLAERGLAISREWGLTAALLSITGTLGHLYALSGRIAEGLALLHDAFEKTQSLAFGFFHSLIAVQLGEASLLGDRPADAARFAERGLGLARDGGQRGCEATARWVLGRVAAHPDTPDADVAEAHYHAALTLADTLGMRPLAAHCHLDRGILYRRLGRTDASRVELARAAGLFGSMGMASWRLRAEAAREAAVAR
jgi:class 3 adenylate cyclase/tetratricopeptide (TPR) repeat protein